MKKGDIMCVISTESHGPEFEEAKDYEVVRPIRIHAVRKRHAEVHFILFQI